MKEEAENLDIRQSDKTHILTKEGFEKLQLELEDLKGNKRPEIAERIKSAMALGDISENAEYEEAKKTRLSSKEESSTLKASSPMHRLSMNLMLTTQRSTSAARFRLSILTQTPNWP